MHASRRSLLASAAVAAPLSRARAPFDDHKLAATTPAEEAFRPVAEGGCSLVRS